MNGVKLGYDVICARRRQRILYDVHDGADDDDDDDA